MFIMAAVTIRLLELLESEGLVVNQPHNCDGEKDAGGEAVFQDLMKARGHLMKTTRQHFIDKALQ